MKLIFVLMLGMILCGAAAPAAMYAQAGAPASSGVYTTQQATRGSALYQSKCASCHNADLSGTGTAPALAGSDFLSNWVSRPVAALFSIIRASMPSDQPGTLTAQQTADLIAYLLKANQFPAGKAELPADADRLKNIAIDNPPSAPAD
jgi:mono/diheme cytochrome c family protein